MQNIFLLVVSQVTSANAFAQTLRRYTSLNHLAQAARAVLQNTAQINQMLSDLNRVDFANVQVGFVKWFHLALDSTTVPLTDTQPSFCLPSVGAGLLGVPVWGPRCPAAGAGLQADPPAAELLGAVGCMAGRGGLSGPKAVPAQPCLPKGCQALPA